MGRKCMARARTEYEVATSSLKLALKRQKITYRELARRLGLSESGIKKILSAEDGSFQRLAQICRELGFSMRELLLGQEESVFNLSYSLPQQEYLSSTPAALRLYWALVYERRPLAEAEELAGVGKKESFSILRKLDQLQLVELMPKGRVRVPAVRAIRWVGGGPLVQKLYQEWPQRLLRAVAKPESGPNELFLVRYFRVTEKTLKDLISAQRDLEAEFVRRATKEMRTEDPALLHLRWLTAVDDRSFL